MQNRYSFSAKNSRFSQPSVQQAPKVSFSSGMTSQQKFNSIVETVQLSLVGKASQTVKGCQMHPKASAKCRKCQSLIQQRQKSDVIEKLSNNLNQVCEKQQFVLSQETPEQIKLNVENPKNHLNQKLQCNITTSNRYKVLRELKSVKEVLGAMSSQQIPIQAYRKGTNEDPTQFMVILYRIIELKPTKPQLMIMIQSNNVNVRALALIYIRLALDYEQIFSFLKLSFNDNKLINAYLTVGQLAEKFLTEQGMDQGGIRMPRIPTKIQKAIENKISQLKAAQNAKVTLQQPNYQFGEIANQDYKIKTSERQERSRSRQKDKKKRSQSSDSSSSSSSSSSNSSSSSSASESEEDLHENIKQKVDSKAQTLVTKETHKNLLQQNSSLEDIRARIQNSIKQKQQKALKARLLTQKYQAQASFQQNQQVQNSYHQQSDQVQKYQLN